MLVNLMSSSQVECYGQVMAVGNCVKKHPNSSAQIALFTDQTPAVRLLYVTRNHSASLRATKESRVVLIKAHFDDTQTIRSLANERSSLMCSSPCATTELRQRQNHRKTTSTSLFRAGTTSGGLYASSIHSWMLGETTFPVSRMIPNVVAFLFAQCLLRGGDWKLKA